MREEILSVNDGPRFAPPFHCRSRHGHEFPQSLGNYRLLTPIGSGQFGIVVLAEHVHLQHRLAVKVFERLGSDPGTLRAFRRSALSLGALDHPNIVKVRDFGITDTLAYLAMELVVPGVAVDLVARQMPIRAVLDLLLQLGSALQHSHSATFIDSEGEPHQGIFHGDVKPANVLMGHDRVYLTDFMIPNMDEFRRRDHGHPCFPYYDTRWYGTPMYMAPEQLQGVVNAQTDIFAFGVMSYELLTGRYPWDSEDDFIPWRAPGGQPRRPKLLRILNDRVPEPLAALVEACIAVHPGDRPTHFTEIVTKLEQVRTESLTDAGIPALAATRSHDYDIALSFAGSERKIAEELYRRLKGDCRVFYDRGPEEKVDLWGSDLATHLHQVYSERTAYCVVLVSKEYVTRAWTNWERRAILQRMVTSDQYVLPIMVDDVEIPGMPPTIGRLRLQDEGIEGIVRAVVRKVGGRQPNNRVKPSGGAGRPE